MTRADLHPELAFLRNMMADRNSEYRYADWLRTPFAAHKWIGRFEGYSSISIDFHVPLNDGSMLTDNKNEELLEIFKCWLCVQTHVDATEGRVLGAPSSYQRVTRTLHVIDYFLLNAQDFDLGKHGLRLITANDLAKLVACLGSVNDITTSVYRWPTVLEDHLRKGIAALSPDVIERAIEEFPALAENTIELEDKVLELSDQEIVHARVWLWLNGYYKRSTERYDYQYTINTQKLAKVLYPATLWGKYKKVGFVELALEPVEKYFREFPAVPTRNLLDERPTARVLASYLSIIRRLGLVAEISESVPTRALEVLDSQDILSHLDIKQLQRTKNIPQGVVFYMLRQAIEFALENGDEIVDGTLAVFAKSRASGDTCETYCRKRPITDLVAPGLTQIGVRTWSLKEQVTFMECNPNAEGTARARRDVYFARLRKNEGLLQLVLVLVGAVQICVGTLMARRQGELMDLIAGNCLDKEEAHLIFYNRKSGHMGLREFEARPIPPVAVRLIKQLERLQRGLVDLGILDRTTNLFSIPTADGRGFAKMYPSVASKSIDLFCDYFEMPLNGKGERYYVRQHQMRRFFAMLFFWGGAFGSMDTLRWFLGHTDIRHLYHYITESIPGDVLRSVQSQFAVEQAVRGTADSSTLADLLERHFGTRNFSILDADELDEYIQELIAGGLVTIEPEFFETREGQQYRILIKVLPAAKDESETRSST